MRELFLAREAQCASFVVTVGKRDIFSFCVFEHQYGDPIERDLCADVFYHAVLFFTHESFCFKPEFFGESLQGDGDKVVGNLLHDVPSVARGGIYRYMGV